MYFWGTFSYWSFECVNFMCLPDINMFAWIMRLVLSFWNGPSTDTRKMEMYYMRVIWHLYIYTLTCRLIAYVKKYALEIIRIITLLVINNKGATKRRSFTIANSTWLFYTPQIVSISLYCVIKHILANVIKRSAYKSFLKFVIY